MVICADVLIGAYLSGWEHVTGIEMESGTVDIATARVQWWKGWSEQTNETDPKSLLKLSKNGKVQQIAEQTEEQLEMFEAT